jgi:hypothetical protein
MPPTIRIDDDLALGIVNQTIVIGSTEKIKISNTEGRPSLGASGEMRPNK